METNLDIHEKYMMKAMELAKGGSGKTNPNPLVGAVVVKDGEIVAEGFHEVLGCAHAEAAAIYNARGDISGGTMYVNLEPCSHFGRTPPCANAIVQAGIKEVVVAMEDPNPKVSGRGIGILKDAGINVITGVLEKNAKKLNEIFIKYITKKQPFVIMKTAMTLDGKIAAATGDSKWITGEKSRQYVHLIRNRVASIMVGINTVLKDDPSLTTRLEGETGADSVRVIVDSTGKIPEKSRVLNVDSDKGVILATTSKIPKEKEEALIKKGVTIIKADKMENGTVTGVDLAKLMGELYKLEIDSILLEGGGTLNSSALQYGIVDKVMSFISPKIIGGANAPTPVEGQGRRYMKDAVSLEEVSLERFDDDILIEGYVKSNVYRDC
ncbi:MAG TPA: bifunctional diaminohydroxyphosphoribosylaminopyrimidine deaminase/5-amino-6-(5-phosphoribosylamino)uracil reductase RibD [Pseudobacteroides sp.]|uniref:bifunctional diaminohydroxyphosphoribosylaminopyrimidine deaminase/5-amino-6-(5-phosphoribosylamino)uracil reductase RibD n=1 Tax=Pseudobacteroides sp. TaxID=1968840 RepID=UPI002F91D3DB